MNYKHGNYSRKKVHYCIELECNKIVSACGNRCKSCELRRRHKSGIGVRKYSKTIRTCKNPLNNPTCAKTD